MRLAACDSLEVRARFRRGSDFRTLHAQAAKVVVSELSYEPTRVTLRAGSPARITFVRTTDKTCGAEVVFPSLSIKRTLPLNEPVVIEFTPAKSGDIAFRLRDEHAARHGRRSVAKELPCHRCRIVLSLEKANKHASRATAMRLRNREARACRMTSSWSAIGDVPSYSLAILRRSFRSRA